LAVAQFVAAFGSGIWGYLHQQQLNWQTGKEEDQKMQKKIALMLVCSGLLLTSHTALAADDMYLQLAGVTGDSAQVGYANWIVLQSFSLSGTSSNKCAGITVVHVTDIATPKLIKLALTGGTVATGTLSVRTIQGATASEYYTVTMNSILVSSVQDAGSISGTTRTLENITLKPQSYVISNKVQQANGTWSVAGTVTVDCTANTVL
jgi:type VI protein secretion system component Hcp